MPIKIGESGFSYLQKLERQDFSSLGIDVIPWRAFNNLANLKDLKLSGNSIIRIEKEAFSDLPSLTSLDLSNLQISSIAASAFYNLPNLRELNLSRNDLQTGKLLPNMQVSLA